ncbi:AN1-type zinc finger protein [Halorubellus sp. PRR65]|uniref:AN1-type zinc finger protein n=1 Tax=Halorubellus sp. PRR65 TaxID=3098148 RepID=UPI002B263E9B|nr:AN1-type zinc finger protein [Halorubellus sp. PRR65]
MALCDACGEESDGLLYTCNECGKTLCSDHRLPEKHRCGLRERATGGIVHERNVDLNTEESSTSPSSDGDEESCAAESCTNRSDYDEAYCPNCLNERDRSGGTQRRQFGKTDCRSPGCNNVAGHGSTYCLDCRRAEQNESSGPPVKTTKGTRDAGDASNARQKDSFLSSILNRTRDSLARISSALSGLFRSS